MATATQIEITINTLKEAIVKTFEELQSVLDNRKAQLLAELVAIQENSNINTEIDATVNELEEARDGIMGALQGNRNADRRTAFTATFNEHIREEQANRVEVPDMQSLELRCYTNKISQTIHEIILAQLLPYYKDKNFPTLSKCMVGSSPGEFDNPRGVATDATNNNMYIADSFNSRIQILSSEGDLVRDMRCSSLTEPYGIALSNTSVYITDTAHDTLLKFNKTGALIQKTGRRGKANGEFIIPIGLTCLDASVIVCDYGNHRLQRFDTDLKFLQTIKHKDMSLPKDIMSSQEHVLFVLLEEANKVLTYNTDYQHTSTIRLYAQEQIMNRANYLTIDKYNNIIITADHSIRIFSLTGEFKHMIELHNAAGIAIDNNDTIICICHDINGCYVKY